MKAKRGDMVVQTVERSDFVLNGGTHTYSHTTLGVVTSIYKNGRVKRAAFPFSADDTAPRPAEVPRFGTLYIVPQSSIRIDEALAAYRDRSWNGSTMVEPFSSVDDCRDFLQSYRTTEDNHA